MSFLRLPLVQALLTLVAGAVVIQFWIRPSTWEEFAKVAALILVIASLVYFARGSRFVQGLLIPVLAFFIFRFGIQPPAPWSVITLFMGIILVAVMAYVSSDSDAWRDFVRPIHETLTLPERYLARGVLVVAIPALLGAYAYTQASARPQPPAELRAVHPAPPDSIQFRGKPFNISGADNPLRKEPGEYAKHVAEGGVIYVRNCMYCHGDNLDGLGHFAAGFNPPPANFQDPGTIAMLQEAYLFWRIAKGGPGLPKESTPWNSVMPAWEDRLTEEQIWQVIMYLYDATGQHPRRWDH